MPLALEIQRKFVDAWNRRDFTTCRDLCHREYSYTGGDGKELAGGPDVAINVAQMYVNAFPDATLTIDRAYQQGDLAIAEMTARGTQRGPFMGTPASGKRVQINMCTVSEIKDGKIHREREYFDMYSLLTQIGAVGMPSQATRTA
jgi:steroid delta-isomerase-like uncharacterized protein